MSNLRGLFVGPGGCPEEKMSCDHQRVVRLRSQPF